MTSCVDKSFAKVRMRSVQEAMFSGATELVQTAARHAMVVAVRTSDFALESEACLTLGRAYILDSRLARGQRFCERALLLSERFDDPIGIARACVPLSFTYAAAGFVEEGIAMGRSAVDLLMERNEEARLTEALCFLGIALRWASEADEAYGVFESAYHLSVHAPDPTRAAFQAYANICFGEVLVIERKQRCGREYTDFTRLLASMEDARAMRKSMVLTDFENAHHIGQVIYNFSRAFAACRLHMPTAADLVAQCWDSCQNAPVQGWTRTLGLWARSELARSKGWLTPAIGWAEHARIQAISGEHQPLAGLMAEIAYDLRQLDAQ